MIISMQRQRRIVPSFHPRRRAFPSGGPSGNVLIVRSFLESSRTHLDDDVVDVTPFSLLDVVEMKNT